VREAARRGGYRLVLQGYGDRLPFPDQYFGSAMSNSVLEHIPMLDDVLVEVARVLQPGAPFVFCVPNHHFLTNLSVSSFLTVLECEQSEMRTGGSSTAYLATTTAILLRCGKSGWNEQALKSIAAGIIFHRRRCMSLSGVITSAYPLL
jgi:ubiquinone/menaquinone biosynthesis C-methylase UbiE